MKYDESTGLPELPSHLFWRVIKDWNGTPKLMIMQKVQKSFLGIKWTKICETMYYTWVYGELNNTSLQEKAEYLVRKRTDRLNSQNLYGDYPPKSLNGVNY